MNQASLDGILADNRIEWRRHALERMIEREISRDTVLYILRTGEIIEDYPDDNPYPSALWIGWVNETPVHVVAALDEETKTAFIITSYYPDAESFSSDYRTRQN